jgi:beta-lactamase superfamily II metal-dependent hydrolase
VRLLAALCCLMLLLNACSLGRVINRTSASKSTDTSDALVYFLDVGQADSELIRLPGGVNILIDAGTTDAGEPLCRYLKDLGVKKIDYLIATHPHEDHIGGMTNVIKQFDIGKVYFPKVADNMVPTTKCYENLLDAIGKKGLKITQGKSGMTILQDGKTKVEFLAPNSQNYKDLNSYSIVTKLSFGSNAVLFMGDADTDSEKEMLKKSYDLSCDILKCGHHGSSTASSAAFLKAAKPKYAIISCGVNNDYGHPHNQTLNRLNSMKITIFRTDKQDTILAHLTGSSITVEPNQKSVIK